MWLARLFAISQVDFGYLISVGRRPRQMPVPYQRIMARMMRFVSFFNASRICKKVWI